MRLAARMTAILLLGVLVLMVIAQYAMFQHENEALEQDMQVDATHLGKTISHIVDDLWELGGQRVAFRSLEEINDLKSTRKVRVVYFDVDPQDTFAPASPDVSLAALRDVYSARCRDPEGREHLYTYSRLAFVGRPAAIELSEPMDDSRQQIDLFRLACDDLDGSHNVVGGRDCGGDWRSLDWPPTAQLDREDTTNWRRGPVGSSAAQTKRRVR